MNENPKRDETWKKAILEWQTQPPMLKEEDFAPKPEPIPSLLDAAKAMLHWHYTGQISDAAIRLMETHNATTHAELLSAAIAAEEARQEKSMDAKRGDLETIAECHRILSASPFGCSGSEFAGDLLRRVQHVVTQRETIPQRTLRAEAEVDRLRAEVAELRAGWDRVEAVLWEATERVRVENASRSQILSAWLPDATAVLNFARAILAKAKGETK